MSKKQKYLKLEKCTFTSESFCPTSLGNKMETNDNSNFTGINCDTTLIYSDITRRFTLLIPEEIPHFENNEQRKRNNKCRKLQNKKSKLQTESEYLQDEAVDVREMMYNKQLEIQKKIDNTTVKNSIEAEGIISLDPGFRTFLAGYTKDHTVDIGVGLSKTIQIYLKQMDKINKSKKSAATKKRAERKRYRKISNMVDDLHWKAAEYLTDNYRTILIGNLSTKSIVKNKTVGDLANMTKRVALLTKLFQFHARLKYKCDIKKCEYRFVNERYSSQLCSYCGNQKKDLGKQKTYNCKSCCKVIDRDTNGSRNIYIVDIQSK